MRSGGLPPRASAGRQATDTGTTRIGRLTHPAAGPAATGSPQPRHRHHRAPLPGHVPPGFEVVAQHLRAARGEGWVIGTGPGWSLLAAAPDGARNPPAGPGPALRSGRCAVA